MDKIVITVLAAIYTCGAAFLAVYGLATLILIALYWRHRREVPAEPVTGDADLPDVLVQLPVYNERHVVSRLIDAVASLDYPRDKLRIQLLDDSTDDTTQIALAAVERHRLDGLDISVVHRRGRDGFKAGALAEGLRLADSELVAIFDADFVPPQDFLRRTVPYMVADRGLGLVQARWGHLNGNGSLVTGAQTVILDAPFVIERIGRSRSGLLFTFSGSAGLWRRECIEDSGGWQSDTLAEDVDLSYRAWMHGWRGLYLPDVVVPAEVPPLLTAYKRQQARWAAGVTQCLLKLAGPIWRSDLTLPQRIASILHLSQYLGHPVALLLLLLTVPLLMGRGLPHYLGFLGIGGLGPMLMYLVSQQALYRDWPARIPYMAAAMLLGMGISLSNTAAVLSALTGTAGEFKRTPKFKAAGRWGDVRAAGTYSPRADWTVLGELALAVYAAWGAYLAIGHAPGLAPLLAAYGLAFGAMVCVEIAEMIRTVERKPGSFERRLVDYGAGDCSSSTGAISSSSPSEGGSGWANSPPSSG